MSTKFKHRFETSEGWTLCNWCGQVEGSALHHKLPEGFRPIETAPKNATNIEVITRQGKRMIAHWAQDLSGEDQLPFKGWFIAVKNDQGKTVGFKEIDDLDGWRPIQISN